MKALKALSLLAMMAATTSCSTYSLEELRHTIPSGSAYQNALAARYLDFADDEARNYDWPDSGYFADKGLLAAYGKDVQPEMLDSWSVPASRVAALAEARTELMNQLTPEKIAQKPTDAADAVAFFDCWIENEEEGWQDDDIAYCRDRHLQAVVRLKEEPPPPPPPAPEEPAPEPKAEEPPAPVVEAPPAPECPKCEPPPQPLVEAPKEEPPAPPPPAPAPIEKQAYLVMFQFNKASVDLNGKLILDGIVKELSKLSNDNYQIVVNGHTDTVGSARFNMELSKKRANAVRQELIDRGIAVEKIQAFGFGETDLKVKTKNGMKEQANRRVEIFIGDEPAPVGQVQVAPAAAAHQAQAPAAASAPEVKAEVPAAAAAPAAEAPAITPPPLSAQTHPAAPVGPVDTGPKSGQTFSAQIRDAVKEKEQAAADAKARAEEAVKAAEQADKDAAEARALAAKLSEAQPSAAPAAAEEKPAAE